MIEFPAEHISCIYKKRGFHCPCYNDALKLWEYLKSNYPGGGKIDQPNLFSMFERYDGVS